MTCWEISFPKHRGRATKRDQTTVFGVVHESSVLTIWTLRQASRLEPDQQPGQKARDGECLEESGCNCLEWIVYG
jgi:hypothetical protein